MDNPKNKTSSKDSGSGGTAWDVHDIYSFKEPVAVLAADVTGDGSLDLIVSHQYGPNMKDCDMTGGRVSWLENPGRDGWERGGYAQWTKRDVGRWPAMHRIKAGYFTQKSVLTLGSIFIDLSKALTVVQVYSRDHRGSGCPWQGGQGESTSPATYSRVSLRSVPDHPCSYPSFPSTGEAKGRVSVTAVSRRVSCTRLTVTT